MSEGHIHTWVVDAFHAGFGCADKNCSFSYWDWSRDELRRLQAALDMVAGERDAWKTRALSIDSAMMNEKGV